MKTIWGRGAYRQDLGRRRELCVRHPWHKQASTSADVLLLWVFLCEMFRGVVVCVGVSECVVLVFNFQVQPARSFHCCMGLWSVCQGDRVDQGHHAVCNKLYCSRRQWQGGGQDVEARQRQRVVGCATASSARLAFRSLPVSGRGEACSAHGE